MHNSSKAVLKRQLLFIGSSIGVSFILTFMVGFLVCSIINTILFIAIVFEIRRQRLKALGKFGSEDKTRARNRNTKYQCERHETKISVFGMRL